MKLIKVSVCGDEWIGQVDNIEIDQSKSIILKEPCQYFIVQNGQQAIAKMVALSKQKDYDSNTLRIDLGPGILVFKIKEDGMLHNLYKEAISTIKLAKNII